MRLNTHTELADPGIHLVNNQYVRERAIWRKKYLMLTLSIREAKQSAQWGNMPYQMFALSVLRERAREMMAQRDFIGDILKETSHKWR